MLSEDGALRGSYAGGGGGRATTSPEQPLPFVDWRSVPTGGHGSSPGPSLSPAPAFSAGGAAAVGALLALIVFLSVAGNVLVCIGIAKDRKLRKVGNLFLVSLAAADLTVSCLVMPFAVVNDMLGYWPFAEWFCNTWVALDVLSATASILNLCAISLDRYMHMKVPFRYDSWMTTGKCAALIGVTWLTALLISVVPINMGWHFSYEHLSAAATQAATSAAPPPEISGDASDANFSAPGVITTATAAATSDEHLTCSFDVNPTYAVVSSAVSFYVPCAAMLSIYAKIYGLARGQAKKIKLTKTVETLGCAPAADAARDSSASPATAAREERDSGASASSSPRPPPARTRKSGAAALRENKALFTLGVILGAFLVSWSPFFAVNVANALCRCVPHELFQAFTWLGYFNSAQNPIIYSIFNVDFRRSFARTLRCRRRGVVRRASGARRQRLTGQADPSGTHVRRTSDAVLQPLLGDGRSLERRVVIDTDVSVSLSVTPSPTA